MVGYIEGLDGMRNTECGIFRLRTSDCGMKHHDPSELLKEEETSYIHSAIIDCGSGLLI